MSAGRFALGAAALTAVVAVLGLGAARLRRRLVPGLDGAIERVADAVLAISMATLVAQVLGVLGWLSFEPLVAGCLAVGGAAAWFGPPAPSAPSRGEGGWRRWTVTAAVAAVAAQWAAWTVRSVREGILDVDSLQYHLPFAARFAQAGRIGPLHVIAIDPVHAFHPQNGELLHAAGMVAFGSDLLSPFLNLGWLVLAIVSAWALVPHPRAWTGPLAVAPVLAAPVLSLTHGGSAGTDLPGLALLLAAGALVVRAEGDRRAMAVAGLAAGLALGTKLSLAAPVAALTVGVPFLLRPGERLRGTLGWVGALVATGGFWYVRNLILVGNPVPPLDLGLLPSPDFPALERYGLSVGHYLGRGSFWADVVPGGLSDAFGPGWPLILVLALAGLARGLAAGPSRGHRVLAAVGTVAALAYVVTPTTAYGPEGNPYLFAANLRFLTPALALGLLTLVSSSRPGRSVARDGWAAAALVAALALTLLASSGSWAAWPGGYGPVAVAAAALAVAVALLWHARPALSRGAMVAAAVVAVGALVVAGSSVAGSYADGRHRLGEGPTGALFAWAQDVRGARIGIVGVLAHYPLYGPALSNHVEYVARVEDDGGVTSYSTCRAFRAAVEARGLDYVVTGSEKYRLEDAPEGGWMSGGGASAVLHAGDVTVFRVTGSFSTACP